MTPSPRAAEDRHPYTTRCRHCGRPAQAKRRGLCRPCYGDPAVRALYPLDRAACGRRGGHADFNGPGLVAGCPCLGEPGTAEKERELADRVARGEALHRQGDAEIPD